MVDQKDINLIINSLCLSLQNHPEDWQLYSEWYRTLMHDKYKVPTGYYNTKTNIRINCYNYFNNMFWNKNKVIIDYDLHLSKSEGRRIIQSIKILEQKK